VVLLLALKIIGIIVLIIFLICQIRVGADIDYTGGNLRISAKFCGLLLQIYPHKASKPKEEKKAEPEKEQKPPKEKKPKRDKKKKKKEKSGPGLMISGDEILELLKKVLEGLGKFSRGFHVDRFKLHWIIALRDPSDTARLFGFVNASLCSLAPVCAERFPCSDVDVWTDVDFTSAQMKLDFGIAVVLRIGAVFSMLFTILFGALGILIRNKIYWWKLKRTDPEEYRFQVENPGLVTKLLRAVMEKSSEEKPSPDAPSQDTPPKDNPPQDNPPQDSPPQDKLPEKSAEGPAEERNAAPQTQETTAPQNTEEQTTAPQAQIPAELQMTQPNTQTEQERNQTDGE
jgi:hypothetical protein